MKVALLPLDDRPVSVQLPVQVAALHGLELLMPEPHCLGHFLQGGEVGRLHDWLLSVAGEVDALIINTDALCYGGLVQSRDGDVTPEDALARLDILTMLKRAFPKLVIYAVSVIMRTTITAAHPVYGPYYEMLSLFAHQRALLPGQPELRGEVERLRNLLPATLIEAFDAARQRNHLVNRRCLELVGESVLDTLFLLQEDCTASGPHRGEQHALIQLRHRLNVQGKVFMHPGADEGSAVCLARLALRETAPAITVMATNPQSLSERAPFEDRSLARTFLGQAAALGLRRCPDAPVLVWLHTPGASAWQLAEAAAEVKRAQQRGQAIYLADVDHPNGGDTALIEVLSTHGLLPVLSGYAAWNTAGNTIGTCLSLMTSTRATEPLQRVVLLTRLIDDWWYQSQARPRLEEMLIGEGHRPVSLDDTGLNRASELLNQLWDCQQVGGLLPIAEAQVRLSLPWPRTFEILVEVTTVA